MCPHRTPSWLRRTSAAAAPKTGDAIHRSQIITLVADAGSSVSDHNHVQVSPLLAGLHRLRLLRSSRGHIPFLLPTPRIHGLVERLLCKHYETRWFLMSVHIPFFDFNSPHPRMVSRRTQLPASLRVNKGLLKTVIVCPNCVILAQQGASAPTFPWVGSLPPFIKMTAVVWRWWCNSRGPTAAIPLVLGLRSAEAV